MAKRSTHALDFWEYFVIPDYRDYLMNAADPRCAFHTSLSMDHLREYVLKTEPLPKREYLKSDRVYVAHLKSIEPLYQPIVDFSTC